MGYPRIDNYDVAARYFAGARSKKDGRPLNTGTRLIKDEYGYVITRYKIPVCRITPDNYITFILPEEKSRCISASLSTTLHKILPFYIKRVGVGRYKLRHAEKAVIKDYNKPSWLRRHEWDRHYADTKQAGDEMFFGIVFNLSTGECTNPMPPKENRKVDKDKRKVWLQRKKTFDQHLSLFGRMGVIDGHISTIFPQREVIPNRWGYSTDPELLTNLKDVFMRDGIPTKEFLIAAVKRVVKRNSFYIGHDPKSGTRFVVEYINKVVRRESMVLRETLGVFTNE